MMEKQKRIAFCERRPKKSKMLSVVVAMLVLLSEITIPPVFAEPVEIQNEICQCVNARGRGRFVDSNDICRRWETKLCWNKEGPPGPPGPGADCLIESGQIDTIAAEFPMWIDLNCFEETDEIVIVANGYTIQSGTHAPLAIKAHASWDTDHWHFSIGVFGPDGRTFDPPTDIVVHWIATVKTIY